MKPKICESKNKVDPLEFLDEIEDISEVLTDSELELVNKIFKNVGDFYRITESIEDALANRVIDKRDIQNLNYVILKVVTSRIQSEYVEEKERGIVRFFFELPETINKILLSKNTI
jgi:hypothetical protein